MKHHPLRAAFTLFELILAVALSAALLALVATAINLYLLRVDAGRTEVEESQLARTILATIAADIRATTMYQTQDISSVAQLASSMADIDVDDLDDAAGFAASAIGDAGGSGGASGGSGSSRSPSGGMGAGMSGSGQSGSGSDSSSQDSTTMLPGLNGSLNELYLDVSRLPRLDEMFAGAPAPATVGTAAAAAGPKPSDAKTIRYFVRQGEAVDASDPAATMLSPEAQLRVGGLVRQTIDQAVRSAAEQTGNTALLDSGQVLLAPEVTAIEFSYFDGTEAVAAWDMRELRALPPAVEVRIWMKATGSNESAAATSAGVAMPGTRMYSQTVDLPLASATGVATSVGSGGNSTEGAGSGTGGLGGTTP